MQRTIQTAGNTKSKCMAEIVVHTERRDRLNLNKKGTNLLGERILEEFQKHLN
ncbi:UNVERIFIED_CONTAM: hypothetical protein FKN15_076064 [Acipenser sinensis]